MTIFVNPTQFGPNEDFARYPRTLDADLQSWPAGVATRVFVPVDRAMYRPGHATYVEVAGPARCWKGKFRPGHFRGVATIVLKLFNLVRPDRAYFGRKDYQQALVMRRMVADLNVPIEIVVCPIVREPDGLALSSRNIYLSPDERRRAPGDLCKACGWREMVDSGTTDARPKSCARMHDLLAADDLQRRLRGAGRSGNAEAGRRRRIGPSWRPSPLAWATTRLIDNEMLGESNAGN